MSQVPRIVNLLGSPRNIRCWWTHQAGNESIWRRSEEFLRQHQHSFPPADLMVHGYCLQRAYLGMRELGIDFKWSEEYPSLLPTVSSIHAPNYCLPKNSEQSCSITSRCWGGFLNEASSMLMARETFPYAQNRNTLSTICRMGSRYDYKKQSTVRLSLPNHLPLAQRYSDIPFYIRRRCIVHSKSDRNHQAFGIMREAGQGKTWAQINIVQTVQDAWTRQW